MFNSSFGANRKFIFGLGIAVFVLAGLGWLAWNIRGARPESGPPSVLPAPAELPAIATTAPAVLPSLSEAPPYRGEPVQVLSADPEVLKRIPTETYQKSKNELADLAVKLAENPRRPDDWMRVAFIKRFYHDYLGARDAYEYLNRINNSDPIPFYNLGSLYGYYLKAPQKAIPKFEAAIRRDPVNISFYVGFADFYREVMQDLPSAEKILLEGLAKTPPVDANIPVALGALYKVMGDAARAVEYYEKALASPAIGGGQRAAISAEVERLRQTLEAK